MIEKARNHMTYRPQKTGAEKYISKNLFDFHTDKYISNISLNKKTYLRLLQ